MMRRSLAVLAGSIMAVPVVAQGEALLRSGAYEVRYAVHDML